MKAIYPVSFLLLLSICQWACTPLPDPPPADEEDLYEIRDSIRTTILFRLGKAKLEINRQAEMMRRRAYSEPEKEARRLRKKAAEMEKAYLELDEWVELIEHDSTMGQWYEHRQRINIFIEQIGYSLNTIM
jgi:hypothetical protein